MRYTASMANPRKHREAILQSAVRLFRKRGYASTGINEILNASGAPKGSLYHYFPGGKAEIGAAAVRHAGSSVAATLRALSDDAHGAAATPEALLARYFEMVGGWIADSGFRDGSPITTTLLETAADHAGIREAGAEAFKSWSAVIEEMLVLSGVQPGRARRMAYFSMAALEGAIVQAHVFQSKVPISDASAELALLIGQARGAERLAD